MGQRAVLWCCGLLWNSHYNRFFGQGKKEAWRMSYTREKNVVADRSQQHTISPPQKKSLIAAFFGLVGAAVVGTSLGVLIFVAIIYIASGIWSAVVRFVAYCAYYIDFRYAALGAAMGLSLSIGSYLVHHPERWKSLPVGLGSSAAVGLFVTWFFYFDGATTFAFTAIGFLAGLALNLALNLASRTTTADT
jgi:hypothetical protein